MTLKARCNAAAAAFVYFRKLKQNSWELQQFIVIAL